MKLENNLITLTEEEYNMISSSRIKFDILDYVVKNINDFKTICFDWVIPEIYIAGNFDYVCKEEDFYKGKTNCAFIININGSIYETGYKNIKYFDTDIDDEWIEQNKLKKIDIVYDIVNENIDEYNCFNTLFLTFKTKNETKTFYEKYLNKPYYFSDVLNRLCYYNVEPYHFTNHYRPESGKRKISLTNSKGFNELDFVSEYNKKFYQSGVSLTEAVRYAVRDRKQVLIEYLRNNINIDLLDESEKKYITETLGE